jgi:hypothetical protein
MSLALTEKQSQEIETFCKIAKENGAAISLRELIGLASIDASEVELEREFRSDSNLKSKFLLEAGYVLDRSSVPEVAVQETIEGEERRRERARTNLWMATRFGNSLIKGTLLVSVGGANSYLSAREDEDIDFFCVTKTNGMWAFMLKALILARIHRGANGEVPELCFSFIMDEQWATQAFRSRQQPIFARDALTAKVIGGWTAYRALLEEASWMRSYFPALYGLRLRETRQEERRLPGDWGSGKAGSAVLNSFLYLTLGSFLRMKSWALNRRLTRAAWHSSVFTTRIGKGHCIYESNRYRKLGTLYGDMEKEG